MRYFFLFAHVLNHNFVDYSILDAERWLPPGYRHLPVNRPYSRSTNLRLGDGHTEKGRDPTASREAIIEESRGGYKMEIGGPRKREWKAGERRRVSLAATVVRSMS